MRRLPIVVALAGLAWLGCQNAGEITDPQSPSSADLAEAGGKGHENAGDAAAHRYEVTIRNLTTGQPFSPGVMVTHTSKTSFWREGEPASEGLRLIAEDGNQLPAVAELTGAPRIHDVVPVPLPIGRIGGPSALPTSRTFTIEGRANANRLSIAVMLICTNDGFTGLSGVKLPGGFKPETHLVGAWDAGTEMNNEEFDQIVDPCTQIGPVLAPDDGNGRVPTSGVIATHPNIQGVGDLDPDLHGWDFPVAEITIQRRK
jgi:hypothetical protein